MRLWDGGIIYCLRHIFTLFEKVVNTLKFEINDTALSFSPLGILFFSLLVYTHSFAYSLAFFLSVITHELGHILVMKLLGEKTYSVSFTGRGISICSQGNADEKEKLLFVLAGPAAGLILFILCKYFDGVYFSRLLADITLRLTVLNLIPCLPLDGGNILLCTLKILFDEKASTETGKIISLHVCFISALTGILLLCCDKGIYFLLLSAFLCYFNMSEEYL